MDKFKFIDNLESTEIDKLLVRLLEKRPASELASAKDQRTALSHVSEHIAGATDRYNNFGRVQGLRTALNDLDAQTLGLVNGELIIVSGYTSMGKTQLVTNIAYRVAAAGHAVLFVTLEMSHDEITSRLMKIAEPGKVDHLPIFYQLENNLDYRDIAGLIKKAKADHAELVIIDHLNMLVRSIDNQTGEAARAVMEIKKAAIKNDIPVILVCHTRKVNDKINGVRRLPELEDLKDTSAIAQDADVVLLVHRDLENVEGNNDEVVVVLAKNRNRGIRKSTRRAYFKSLGIALAGRDDFIKGDYA